MIVIVDGEEVNTDTVIDLEDKPINSMKDYGDFYNDIEDTQDFDFEDLDASEENINLEETLDLAELLSDE